MQNYAINLPDIFFKNSKITMKFSLGIILYFLINRTMTYIMSSRNVQMLPIVTVLYLTNGLGTAYRSYMHSEVMISQ